MESLKDLKIRDFNSKNLTVDDMYNIRDNGITRKERDDDNYKKKKNEENKEVDTLNFKRKKVAYLENTLLFSFLLLFLGFLYSMHS